MSSAPAKVSEYATPANEWTIMVFFAGDPHLSPSMTAQLKAIKDAGFQENASVLVYYDPNERGVGTTTFDINSKRKKDLLKNNQKGTRIGDGKDPFVRNLVEDALESKPPKPATADQALRTFLDIGAKPEYQAKHYVIFLVGHGVIVGNDMFLPESNPQSGISLTQLGDTLRHFRGSIPDGSVIELIGLHSCSMSAIEVVFELKGVANYMMATEGESYVASWPYRQLLKKILNAVDDTKTEEAQASQTQIDVGKLITSIHGLSLHNSTDFLFSGLSADLCLCSLDKDRVEALELPIQNLVKALKQAMIPPVGWNPEKDWRALELIKLAHLESQSYFQETYTDLYDFCLCLGRRCDEELRVQKDMKDACDAVRDALKMTAPKSVIVQSDHFGPMFQYSHGLSIFFPWARPVQEEPAVLDDNVLTRYEKYAFTKELGTDSWLSFLDDYFTGTQRRSREKEDGKPIVTAAMISRNGTGTNGIGVTPNAIVDALAKDSPSLAKDSPSLKDSPRLSEGCTCSIKNFPMEFSISVGVAGDPNPDATKRDREAKQATKARQAEPESVGT